MDTKKLLGLIFVLIVAVQFIHAKHINRRAEVKEKYEEKGITAIVVNGKKFAVVEGGETACAKIHGLWLPDNEIPRKNANIDKATLGKCFALNQPLNRYQKPGYKQDGSKVDKSVIRWKQCSKEEAKYVFCSLSTNKLDPKSKCYHSPCADYCDEKTGACSCVYRKLGDDAHSCFDACVPLKNCEGKNRPFNIYCKYSSNRNAVCKSLFEKGIYLPNRPNQRYVPFADIFKTMYGYISPKIDEAKLRTDIIDQIKPAGAAYYDICQGDKVFSYHAEPYPNVCRVYDTFQQLETLLAIPEQLSKKDRKVVHSEEWEDVGLQKYLQELKEDLKTKRESFANKKDAQAQADTLGGDKMGNYFEKLANFDISTGEADAGFINSELKRLKAGSVEIFSKLKLSLKAVLKEAFELLTGEVADRVVDVMLNIAQCFNPFAIVAGNCDLASIKGAIESLGDATKRLTKAKALQKTMDDLMVKVKAISEGYLKNEEQYGVMWIMVGALKTGDEKTIRRETDRFLRYYASYTPVVTSQDLAYVLGLFETVGDMGCGLKDSATGVDVNVKQTIKAAIRDYCDKIPALMAMFQSYHTELFTFQFEFVDKLAAVVRGYVAKNNLKKVQEAKAKKVKAMPLMDWVPILLIDYIKINKVANIYCNYLEYMNGGKRPASCSKKYFTDESLSSIISQEVPKTGELKTYTATLPTKVSKTAGVTYIDLHELSETKKLDVYLQLPKSNAKWLVEHKWIGNSGELSSSLQVHKFELFIPHLSSDPKCNYKFQARFKTDPSNQLLDKNYLLERHSFKLQANTDTKNCKNAEDNPADKKTKICVESAGDLTNDGTVPAPSLFTLWKGKLSIRGDCKPLSKSELDKIKEVAVRISVDKK